MRHKIVTKEWGEVNKIIILFIKHNYIKENNFNFKNYMK